MIELIRIHPYAISELYCYWKCLCAIHITIDKERSIKVYIGACINNLVHRYNKDIANRVLFLYYKVCFMLNGKIAIINRYNACEAGKLHLGLHSI